MDSLKLNMAAVDQIHPLLSDLMQSVQQLPVDAQFAASKEKLLAWLIKLNKYSASHQLDADDVRQLLFDLESAHLIFYRSLSSK
jgi:ESCRT-I complex subunit VPS28